MEPCKDAHFKNYYELLVSGIDVRYDDYENYQKPYIDSLLDKGYLTRGKTEVMMPEDARDRSLKTSI